MKKVDGRNFFTKILFGAIGFPLSGYFGMKIFAKRRVPKNIKITESIEAIKRIK